MEGRILGSGRTRLDRRLASGRGIARLGGILKSELAMFERVGIARLVRIKVIELV